MKTQSQIVTAVMILIALALIAPLAYGKETARVSISTGGTQGNNNSFLPSLNENGQFVAFHSFSNNLVTGDTNNNLDVFVRNRQTGETTRVSVATVGTQGNNLSRAADLSNDGNLVSFESNATNLVAGDTNAKRDIFVRDRQAGTTTRVSLVTGGGQVNGDSFNSALSGDGRFVAFDSVATNLVAGDTNGVSDVFVHDRQTGETTRVSLATGAVQANGGNFLPALSMDGRFVAFHSTATNLVAGDTNGGTDVFVHDRQTGETTRVSVATGGEQSTGSGGPPPDFAPDISADGRFVAFESISTNLVAGDTNGILDVFVHDRQTVTTTRVSVPTGGSPQANDESVEPAISGDGRFVVFLSFATNLVPGGTSGNGDVFVHDRQTNTTTQMSVSTGGVKGNDFSCNPAISQDGRIVAMFSDATNLIVGDTNGVRDIFIHNRTVDFDLDGEGRADIVWRNTSNGATAIWFLNGTALASAGFPGGVPLVWQIAGVGDVNGDGMADVIWRNGTIGTVAVWFMDGLTITSVGFPGSTSTDWEIEQIGDVDGNGTADFVWRNTNSGVVAVWLMDGATIISPGFLGGVPAVWQIVGIGDVNGDGKADVIWRNNTGVVAVWLMNGPTITSVGFPGSAPLDFEFAGSGDVDGNGTTDLFWRNTNNGSVVLWFMNGTTIASSGNVASLSSNEEIEVVEDTNGDGRPDLVIRNTTTGAVSVLLAGGGSGSPGSVPLEWEIQN
jgi:cold shock CspA family protein